MLTLLLSRLLHIPHQCKIKCIRPSKMLNNKLSWKANKAFQNIQFASTGDIKKVSKTQAVHDTSEQQKLTSLQKRLMLRTNQYQKSDVKLEIKEFSVRPMRLETLY